MLTPEVLQAVRKLDKATAENEITEIWPDMATAVTVFFALTTQWRRGFMGEMLGLDYAQIEPTARLMGLELERADFHNLRTMEAEVVRLARRRK